MGKASITCELPGHLMPDCKDDNIWLLYFLTSGGYQHRVEAEQVGVVER